MFVNVSLKVLYQNGTAPQTKIVHYLKIMQQCCEKGYAS